MVSRTRPLTITLAERARTILAGCTTLRVRVPGLTLEVHRHALGPDGSVLFQAPGDLPLQHADLTAIDVSAVPQPDRIRGTVILSGPLSEVTGPLPAGLRAHLTGSDAVGSSRLLRLAPEEIQLDWRCERTGGVPVPVSPESYRAAFPDPLVAFEAEWLPHLQDGHADLLATLARHELGTEEDELDVRALGLDRYGVVLRVRDTMSTFDLRVAFDRPVTCGCDVREAFGALVDRVS